MWIQNLILAIKNLFAARTPQSKLNATEQTPLLPTSTSDINVSNLGDCPSLLEIR
jgi:hypothetical protein